MPELVRYPRRAKSVEHCFEVEQYARGMMWLTRTRLDHVMAFDAQEGERLIAQGKWVELFDHHDTEATPCS